MEPVMSKESDLEVLQAWQQCCEGMEHIHPEEPSIEFQLGFIKGATLYVEKYTDDLNRPLKKQST